MKYQKPLFSMLIAGSRSVIFVVLFAATVFLQTNEKTISRPDTGYIRSSAAYAEILLRKTELQADVEALSADYTEANPKLLDLRFEIGSLDKELEKVFGVKASDAGKLTLALGKLIVKKASLDAELEHLTRSYNKDHPEVKRARRRVDIFDAAIKEILR